MTECEGITLPQRTYRALDHTDSMPPDLRACVHEFGYSIVSSLLQAGVSDPNRMRSLVHSIWLGARQPHQRNPVGRRRSPVLDSLDWLLAQNDAGISAATLLWHLKMHNMVVVPLEPSTPMLDASMHAIDGMTMLSKPTKHRIRLKTAIAAGAQRLWPHLFAVAPKRKPSSSAGGEGTAP